MRTDPPAGKSTDGQHTSPDPHQDKLTFAYMNPTLEARRQMRMAITEIESANYALEMFGPAVDPNVMIRSRIASAISNLYSINWSELNALHQQHNTDKSDGKS